MLLFPPLYHKSPPRAPLGGGGGYYCCVDIDIYTNINFLLLFGKLHLFNIIIYCYTTYGPKLEKNVTFEKSSVRPKIKWLLPYLTILFLTIISQVIYRNIIHQVAVTFSLVNPFIIDSRIAHP